jgi:hypothetical protein
MRAPTAIRTPATIEAARFCAAVSAVLCAATVAFCQAAPGAREPDSHEPAVLDRVVAVVNNQAILSSEVAEEVRLSVLEPASPDATPIAPARALEEIVSRTLVQQQMRREDVQSDTPKDEEIDVRIREIRRELPACAKHKCGSDQEWAVFLAVHGLTAKSVENYLRNRMEILRFIEDRFRQGIRVAPQEVEDYYGKTLLPQLGPGAAAPSLESVSARIEEILVEQKVNALFDDWLMNLRRQGEVEVLDPDLELPGSTNGSGEGT